MKNAVCKIFVILLGFMISAGTAQAAGSLIRYGGFEVVGLDGNPTGWKPSSWGGMTVSYDYPAIGRSGGAGKSVGITVLNTDATISDRGASWRTTFKINVLNTKQFTYIDWVKGNTTVYLDAEFKMKNGSMVYQSLGGIFNTGGVWKKTVTPIGVPSGAVTMSIYRVITQIGSFTVDDVSLLPVSVPKNVSGYVTFSFDDGYSEKNVPPLLKRLKIPGTFYINPVPVTQKWDPNYFTPKEVRAIAAGGNEIGNHSGKHFSLPSLSNNDLFTEVSGSKDSLEKMIGRPISTFAYPYGEYDRRVINSVIFSNHAAARGVEASDGIEAGINARTQDIYTLRAECIRSTATVNDVKLLINYAAETDQWLILCFHQFDQAGEWNYPLANLEQIINYAKTKTRIITVQQGVLNFLQE